ncbi:MAG: hypothetical protein N3C12_06925 [Candidatus Binatia bacterium]|nr:hypothetical protein [Candidatus Binatia bacterium]
MPVSSAQGSSVDEAQDQRGTAPARLHASATACCLLVAGILNGTLTAVDPAHPDRAFWRLALFRQVSRELMWAASHTVTELNYDEQLQRVYVSAVVSRTPFDVGDHIESGEAAGFLAAYEWPSLRRLWRIWAEDRVGRGVVRDPVDGLIYSFGPKAVAAIDPATGQVLRELTRPDTVAAVFVDPDQPEAIYVVAQSELESVRLLVLRRATFEVTLANEFALPSATRLILARFDSRQKLLHFFTSNSRWRVVDLSGSLRVETQFPLTPWQWLVAPA